MIESILAQSVRKQFFAELDDNGIACVSRAIADSPATIVIASPVP